MCLEIRREVWNAHTFSLTSYGVRNAGSATCTLSNEWRIVGGSKCVKAYPCAMVISVCTAGCHGYDGLERDCSLWGMRCVL